MKNNINDFIPNQIGNDILGNVLGGDKCTGGGFQYSGMSGGVHTWKKWDGDCEFADGGVIFHGETTVYGNP